MREVHAPDDEDSAGDYRLGQGDEVDSAHIAPEPREEPKVPEAERPGRHDPGQSEDQRQKVLRRNLAIEAQEKRADVRDSEDGEVETESQPVFPAVPDRSHGFLVASSEIRVSVFLCRQTV